MLVVIGLILYLLINGGAWIYDDNLFLIQEAHSGLTWDWLTAPIFQHWGIGYQFVYAVIHKLMPLDYRWALAGMLVTLIATAYLMQRIISLLFGWGWRAVLIAAYFCLSIFFVRNLQWLASGLQAVPGAFWDVLCLYAYVRFQIDGSRRWMALAAGALAGGLLFFERPLYMLLYLGLFRILFLSDDLRPPALIRTFLSEWQMWGALLLVAAIWAIGYSEAGAGQGLTAGTASASQYVRFFQILWAQTLIPGLLGFTVPAVGVSAIEVVVTVALELALVAVVAYSVRRKPSAWRGWLFFLIPVLFSVARRRADADSDVRGDRRPRPPLPHRLRVDRSAGGGVRLLLIDGRSRREMTRQRHPAASPPVLVACRRGARGRRCLCRARDDDRSQAPT